MSYRSNIGKTPVIDDNNRDQYFDPVVNGQPKGRGREFPDPGMRSTAGIVPWPFTNHSRAELVEGIKAREAEKSCTRDITELLGVKIKDQGQTPLCWSFAVTRMLEVAMAKAGQFVEPLSPGGSAARITGYKYRGGYGSEIIDFLIRTGATYTRLWPDQSVSKKSESDEADAVRPLNRVVEAYRLPDGDDDACHTALNMGFTVSGGIPSWAHEINFEDLRILANGDIVKEFANSWTYGYGDNGRGILTPKQCRGADYIAIKFATRT